jgi:hypothetical protein
LQIRGDIPAVVTINFYLKCPDYQPGIIDLPVTFNVGVPVNLYAETVYEITVQDDRFLPILEDTVFHANADYLILLDSI